VIAVHPHIRDRRDYFATPLKQRLRPMADQTLTCSQCQKPFSFSTGEQEFYQLKGLKPPTRCKVCRANRKQDDRRDSDTSVDCHDGK